jgi:hypothetical protein
MLVEVRHPAAVGGPADDHGDLGWTRDCVRG